MPPSLLQQAVRFWHTARHLKGIQLYGRLVAWARRRMPVAAASEASLRPGGCPPRVPFLPAVASSDGRHFTFLNESADFSGGIDWQPRARAKLWRYNLHYFDYLPGLPAPTALPLVADWIARNRDQRAEAWDPYPLSLRLVNWCKWLAVGPEQPPEVLRSLHTQARSLARNLEYHIQANHLFENAKALLWAGLFLAGPEADGWLRQGEALLCEQLAEQILADGGHYERSPMYHAIVLGGCLDLLNLTPQLQQHAPALLARLQGLVPGMIGWLAAMCHPDGEIALFNDAAFGIAPAPASLFAYARALGLAVPEPPASSYLQQSGYVAARAAAGHFLVVDVGELGPAYQPGHAHCDTLSFELSLFGERVVVDTGTSSYQDAAARQYERGTAAHNTARLDCSEQSEIWGHFRVGRRARPVDVQVQQGPHDLQVAAGHTGYDRLGVRHHRRLHWAGNVLTITDRFAGTGRHEIEVFFHLHPRLAATVNGQEAVLRAGGEPVMRLEVLAGPEPRVEAGWYCPEFGRRQENQVLVLAATVELPAEFACRLRWDQP